MSFLAPSRTMLAIECLLLFFLLPFAMWAWFPQGFLFATLWVLAIACLLVWRAQNKRRIREACWKMGDLPPPLLKLMGWRFLTCSIALAIFVACYDPARFLELPMEKPGLWAMIMVFYPLVSVFPQEVMYRLFFFDRYAPLFPNERIMVLMSGLAFGHGHLIFNNWVAYVMSVLGGWIFAYTYARSRSFPLVWIEHAVYGCFIFTIGLGWYFYSGGARVH